MCLGIPGKIVEIYPAPAVEGAPAGPESTGLLMGKIDFGGVTREVCLAYVPEAQVGDYGLVHVGFVLNLISEAEAFETLDLLRQIADVEAELGPDPAAV